MTAVELKTILIQRISEINDISFLKAIKTILDSKTDSGVLRITDKQLEEIIEAKKQIQQGLFIESDELDKDVSKWLSER